MLSIVSRHQGKLLRASRRRVLSSEGWKCLSSVQSCAADEDSEDRPRQEPILGSEGVEVASSGSVLSCGASSQGKWGIENPQEIQARAFEHVSSQDISSEAVLREAIGGRIWGRGIVVPDTYPHHILADHRASALRSLAYTQSRYASTLGYTYSSGRNPLSRAVASPFRDHQIVFFSSKPSRTIGTTKIPTPESSPPQSNPLETLRKTTTKSIVRKGLDLTISIFRTVVTFLVRLPGNIFYYITHPEERRNRIAELKQLARDEAHHYWVGTKLLWADIQTARNLLGKTLEGNALTRRERKQLLRTVSDLFRLVPFSMFVLIPFMEFALPFALRIFPNLLPSTFQDSLKAEETMKRELQSRIAMAQFFQETLEELAKEQKRKASKKKKELVEAGVDLEKEGTTIDSQEETAANLLKFLENARSGEMIPPDAIIRYANLFHDDLTLDNMPRMQLINMCRYMSIPPYGSDSFLRFQLRHKIRVLKEDDQRILWEGIDSLTKMELREACQERGMRSTGLSKDSYKRALQMWLDLSVNKNVPISLLIMSRTFFLREEMFERKVDDDGAKSLAGLVDAISGLDKEVLNEVILDVATSEEKSSNPDIQKIKLEVVSTQNELIRKEEADREAAVKKKEASEKEKADREKEKKASEGPAVDTSQESHETTVSTSTVTIEAAVPSPELDVTVSEEEDKEEERSLSTEEMDALSHLVADDPVSRERAELEKIKAAMKGDGTSSVDEAEATESNAGDAATEVQPVETTKSMQDHKKSDVPDAPMNDGTVIVEAVQVEEDEDDPVVARLKKRLETMVDKIEVQMSDVKTKIGDKLHMLDKDKDGILTPEEMALCLHQVLKREITMEEAMEIAEQMDENHDGMFTVDELINWIDQHKLVKFVEEGRDADMDRVIESQKGDDPVDSDTSSQKSADAK